ncbi:MAG: Asp-tRNA(Asn)/Glu-tRNA(Gln) amidotransferase subunit GatB [Acidobacteriota bacterium]|jgi:aspartyl-tRNA(Asn)/glutamyl-tRNA(Gln) amidotransferase subunit B
MTSNPTTYEAVIGLEVHAQLRTRTKIFCGCETAFGAPPNHNVCPVCLGFPGTLPVLNRAAVDLALRMGLAVGARIPERSEFARKNYFYPDLPKGYQISQYDRPLCEGGAIPIEIGGTTREIGLIRIHLEEDAGKLVHGLEQDGAGAGSSHIDYNRAGVPLIEIVARPEIHTPEEAHRYLVRLRSLVTYLEVCDGNMEEGSLRCDANVSLRPAGSDRLGTRIEVKNLNSFRHVQRALEHEIARQEDVLRGGGEVIQETRLWDEAAGETRTMRTKEEAHDYRYFPEPDLPPLEVDRAWLDRVREVLPELPQERRQRFRAACGLSEEDADFLSLERPLADYFDAVARQSGSPRAAANWVRGELLRVLKERKLEIAASPVSPAALAGLIRLVEDATISGKIAKTVFEEMCASGDPPEAIVERLGLAQITDEGAIRDVVAGVLEKHPGPAAEYRAGKKKALGFLVGQVMAATGGRANPGLVNRLLQEALDEPA